MAMEPMTLFSRIADPAGVARRLRELHDSVEIDGPDHDWRHAVLMWNDGNAERTLTFTHNPEYYSEPNWSTQMNGMRGYFSRFPDSDRKERAIMLTTTFKFSLGTILEPDFDPEGDPRLAIVFDVAELLDGVLFTPSSLRDANGRILFGAGGEDEENPDAVWPKVAAEVSIAEPAGAETQESSRPGNLDEGDGDTGDPPTAERVARRALALTAVTGRAILEQDLDNPETPEVYADLLKWAGEIDIEDEFEPDEWAVLQRPLGQMDPQMQANATWRLEGLVVLAWALSRFEIPPHDELVELSPLWRSLGLLDAAAAKELLADAALRPREEIAALRNRLFGLHWRMRNQAIHPGPMDFAEFAETCWFGPLDISGLPLVEGDLALGGVRIDEASADAVSTAHSTAQERHQAANWLWKGPARYSEASVDT